MVNVTFYGNVTSKAGETVTVTVTKPDNTTETLTALTLADQTYTTTPKEFPAGSYKAQAHIDESADYFEWFSAEKAFTVPKAMRTGTLEVTVA